MNNIVKSINDVTRIKRFSKIRL